MLLWRCVSARLDHLVVEMFAVQNIPDVSIKRQTYHVCPPYLIQKPPSANTSQLWKFNNGRSFSPYDSASQKTLHKEYARGAKIVTLSRGKYTVDFSRGIQTNMATKYVILLV